MIDHPEIPWDLIQELRQAIACRRIQAGMQLLEANRHIYQSFCGEAKNAPEFLGYFAQWVDIGYGDVALVKELLARMPADVRRSFSVSGYVHLHMAEGMVAMAEEEQSRAIAHFEIVLMLATEIGDGESAAIANYWKARCHRKNGEYDHAFAHTILARDLALQCGLPRMAAVICVLESWLHFQRGKYKEALSKLAAAEDVLAATDDHVTLGNIQSTYGRIFRQEGRLDASIERFANAIAEYRKYDPEHPNVARTLANMAYVERLVALQFRNKIDAETARRRRAAGKAENGLSAAAWRERFRSMRDQAFAHLQEAARIYRLHMNHHGSGTVCLHRGFLYFDNGELDLAGEQAAEAYALGCEKDDFILRARARILQCMTENAKLEEGIEEGNGDPRQHAQAALDYAREAAEFAKHTQNRRLLARAHTWHGLTLANEFFGSLEAARELMSLAETYIQSDFHDTAWDDLEILRQKLLKSSNVHHSLQEWSMGMVGDKTFQQITEEFAAIIIPKVWEAEGRKVSRVATRLSVSPKKVRRILIRAGLLESRAHAAAP